MPYEAEMSPPDPKQWLEEMFEYEYCGECGGDACHHTAVTAAGLPFARCDYPADDNGAYHPAIRQYHDRETTVTDDTAETLDVIFRRLPVEPDRKPRRVLPTDIIAIMPYMQARPGHLCDAGFITYSTGDGCSDSELPLSRYLRTKPVRIEDVPPELIAWLQRNDDGEPFKLRVRRRLPSDFREKAWHWPRLGQAD